MSESMAYVGRKPCGCVPFVTVDNPDHAKRVAHEVAQAIREGLAVERMTVNAARPLFGRCPEHRPPTPAEEDTIAQMQFTFGVSGIEVPRDEAIRAIRRSQAKPLPEL